MYTGNHHHKMKRKKSHRPYWNHVGLWEQLLSSHLNPPLQQEMLNIKSRARQRVAKLLDATNVSHNQLLVERSIIYPIQMKFSACFWCWNILVLPVAQQQKTKLCWLALLLFLWCTIIPWLLSHDGLNFNYKTNMRYNFAWPAIL